MPYVRSPALHTGHVSSFELSLAHCTIYVVRWVTQSPLQTPFGVAVRKASLPISTKRKGARGGGGGGRGGGGMLCDDLEEGMVAW